MDANINSVIMLRTVISQEEAKIKRWEEEMNKLPQGSLYCLCRSEKTYFYVSIEGKRKGITKNRELVHALARKKYLKLLIACHWDYLNILKNGDRRRGTHKRNVYISRDEASIKKQLEYFAAAGLDVARITCTTKQYHWMNSSYDQNPITPELRTYITYSGVAVRSKSEQSIGNALEMRGVPYRYEPRITLDVSWMEGVSVRLKDYYPDFVIMTADGTKIIWEHLGRVDKKDYRDHNMEKISAYRQGLGIEERQLILTFEKDFYSQETKEKIIDDRIMPHM